MKENDVNEDVIVERTDTTNTDQYSIASDETLKSPDGQFIGIPEESIFSAVRAYASEKTALENDSIADIIRECGIGQVYGYLSKLDLCKVNDTSNCLVEDDLIRINSTIDIRELADLQTRHNSPAEVKLSDKTCHVDMVVVYLYGERVDLHTDGEVSHVLSDNKYTYKLNFDQELDYYYLKRMGIFDKDSAIEFSSVRLTGNVEVTVTDTTITTSGTIDAFGLSDLPIRCDVSNYISDFAVSVDLYRNKTNYDKLIKYFEDTTPIKYNPKDVFTPLYIKKGSNQLLEKNYPQDACYDVMAGEDAVIPSKGHGEVSMKCNFGIIEGVKLCLRVRSGHAKRGVFVFPGTCDSFYTGEPMVHLGNLGEEDLIIKKGDRIGQLSLERVLPTLIVPVNDLEFIPKIRGNNGMGSSGVVPFNKKK